MRLECVEKKRNKGKRKSTSTRTKRRRRESGRMNMHAELLIIIFGMIVALCCHFLLRLFVFQEHGDERKGKKKLHGIEARREGRKRERSIETKKKPKPRRVGRTQKEADFVHHHSFTSNFRTLSTSKAETGKKGKERSARKKTRTEMEIEGKRKGGRHRRRKKGRKAAE